VIVAGLWLLIDRHKTSAVAQVVPEARFQSDDGRIYAVLVAYDGPSAAIRTKGFPGIPGLRRFRRAGGNTGWSESVTADGIAFAR
jgi:hypothetical protein